MRFAGTFRESIVIRSSFLARRHRPKFRPPEPGVILSKVVIDLGGLKLFHTGVTETATPDL